MATVAPASRQTRAAARSRGKQGLRAIKGCVADRLLHGDGEHAPPAKAVRAGARAPGGAGCAGPPSHLAAEDAEALRATGHQFRVGGVLAPYGGPQDSPICRRCIDGSRRRGSPSGVAP